MEFGKIFEERHVNFNVWKDKVANIIIEKTAVHPDDLPDFNYRERYELGHTSSTTANEYLKTVKCEEIFHYWVKYIQNEYFKHRKINLSSEIPLKKMFDNKITCYKVIEELIK